MKKLTAFRAFIALLLVAGLVLGLSIGPRPADAELASTLNTSLCGVNISGALGNTAAAQAGIKVDPKEVASSYTLYLSVVNASNVVVGNTATVDLEGSYDGTNYADLHTGISVAASGVTLVSNSASAKFRYVRANITAIQNTNASYVNVSGHFK